MDISRWSPEQEEFDFLCGLLPEADVTEVRRFRFEEDRQRAAVSRLLQRAAASKALGIKIQEIEIKRTKGRKPYVANEEVDRTQVPNFNFSVSHEGDFVVLASEDVVVCGCDIAAPHQLRRGGKKEPLIKVLEAFKGQLTESEWKYIFLGEMKECINEQHDGVGANGTHLNDPSQRSSASWPPYFAANSPGLDENDVDTRFRQIWSLKEAFVKATGEGLGFDLGRIEFGIDDKKNVASVSIDGKRQKDWKFHMHCLGRKDREHWIAVARGPLTAIVDAWGVRD